MHAHAHELVVQAMRAMSFLNVLLYVIPLPLILVVVYQFSMCPISMDLFGVTSYVPSVALQLYFSINKEHIREENNLYFAAIWGCVHFMACFQGVEYYRHPDYYLQATREDVCWHLGINEIGHILVRFLYWSRVILLLVTPAVLGVVRKVDTPHTKYLCDMSRKHILVAALCAYSMFVASTHSLSYNTNDVVTAMLCVATIVDILSPSGILLAITNYLAAQCYIMSLVSYIAYDEVMKIDHIVYFHVRVLVDLILAMTCTGFLCMHLASKADDCVTQTIKHMHDTG